MCKAQKTLERHCDDITRFLRERADGASESVLEDLPPEIMAIARNALKTKGVRVVPHGLSADKCLPQGKKGLRLDFSGSGGVRQLDDLVRSLEGMVGPLCELMYGRIDAAYIEVESRLFDLATKVPARQRHSTMIHPFLSSRRGCDMQLPWKNIVMDQYVLCREVNEEVQKMSEEAAKYIRHFRVGA